MLNARLAPQTDRAFALMRVLAGLMFAFHGSQKILGLLSERQPPVGSQIWIGGLIELLCGLCIALGFQTRLTAFLASGTMAVAYTQFHWQGALGSKFFPAINGGELALLYCVVFFFIACRGPGPLSVDSKRG